MSRALTITKAAALGGLAFALTAGAAAPAMAETHAKKPLTRPFDTKLGNKKPTRGGCTIKSNHSKDIKIRVTYRAKNAPLKVRAYSGAWKTPLTRDWVAIKHKNQWYKLNTSAVRAGTTICWSWAPTKAVRVKGDLSY
ncbi:hypothetical protein [Actinoallomurus sp. NPDC050550]|uniref:hypothetical protein n=1 Tax=Actinoallomurus sp. NPDC050550 TaxID=3154937 RepID=UPI0033F7DD4D